MIIKTQKFESFSIHLCIFWSRKKIQTNFVKEINFNKKKKELCKIEVNIKGSKIEKCFLWIFFMWFQRYLIFSTAFFFFNPFWLQLYSYFSSTYSNNDPTVTAFLFYYYCLDFFFSLLTYYLYLVWNRMKWLLWVDFYFSFRRICQAVGSLDHVF